MSEKINTRELRKLQDKGIMRGFERIQDAQAPFTANNIGMPAGLLSQVSVDVVRNILAKRSGDEILGGRKKVIDWEKQDYYVPFVEQTGQTTPYGDFNQPKVSGANVNFARTGHYVFSAKYQYGDREASQYAQSGINYIDYCLASATEAIAVEYNRSLVSGFMEASGSFLVYGLLNNPHLPAYLNSSSTFAQRTWDGIMSFFAGALQALVTQSGNNINALSRLRCAVSASAFAQLQAKFTTQGFSVVDLLRKTYPNMEFVPAIELDAANANQNVLYLIGDSEVGGGVETSIAGYSELARMGNVVYGDYSFSQSISAGSLGALFYKPSFVIRFSGV